MSFVEFYSFSSIFFNFLLVFTFSEKYILGTEKIIKHIFYFLRSNIPLKLIGVLYCVRRIGFLFFFFHD